MTSPNTRMNEADRARFDELFQEYIRNAHGVQTGIAMRLEIDPTFGTTKDLRVGVDTGRADTGGLVELLIQKGIFTDVEYMEAILASMKREREMWAQNISELLGREVTLL